MQQRLTRYLTFGLAFCTVASNVAYLVYIRSHSMVRAWSGINAVLLGLFFFGWALLMLKRKGRSPALAIGLIGALNLAAGVLFFF